MENEEIARLDYIQYSDGSIKGWRGREEDGYDRRTSPSFPNKQI